MSIRQCVQVIVEVLHWGMPFHRLEMIANFGDMVESLKKKVCGALMLGCIGLTQTGCNVFVDMGLKNSTFELYRAQIPGNETNMMTLFLPGYQENDPGYRYVVNYFGNDRCTGAYYAADTLNYEVEGTWYLVESDVMFMDIDGFVNGEFLITKLDRNTYLLKSEANTHGLPFEPAATPLHLFNLKIH